MVKDQNKGMLVEPFHRLEERMSNTFGDFVVAVAYGDERSRTMSQQEANRAHQEMCEAVGPSIEAIRSEQRKVSEDALTVMVF